MKLHLWEVICIIIYVIWLINTLYVITAKYDKIFIDDPESEYMDDYGCTNYCSYTPFTNLFLLIHFIGIIIGIFVSIFYIPWTKIINIF